MNIFKYKGPQRIKIITVTFERQSYDVSLFTILITWYCFAIWRIMMQQSPMCQLKVKVTVKGQIIYKQYYTLCRVRSITPLLMEEFPSNLNDTFTSTSGCAEPMLPMRQLKVKVTVKCQISNKQILDFMSCPLYKPYTNDRISLDAQSPCCPCVSSRSRSPLKVKYKTNKY